MNQQSMLLRVVILLTLGLSANAHATIEEDAFDLDRVRATLPDDSGTYNNSHDSFFGGASSFDDSAYYDDDSFPVPDVPSCDELWDSAPEGCNIANPPTLTTNGCGGGPTAGIVPDSLVLVDDGAVSIAFPGLFSNACDRHDRCYGTHPGNKGDCDAALANDMLTSARNTIPPIMWRRYGSTVMNQINGYGAFFDSSVGTSISMVFFNSAQSEGLCRAYSHSIELYCRSYQ